ncbi:MAG TPA: hypothetical protein VGE21_17190 [Flavobacteriales bacterium]
MLSRCLVLALLSLVVLVVCGQVVNEDALRKIPLAGNTAQIIDIEVLPDGHTLLASCAKGAALLVIDTNDWRITRTIALSGFSDGAQLSIAPDGHHVLLRERSRYFADPAHERSLRTAVLDLRRDALVLERASDQDATWMPHGATLATLSGTRVAFHALDGDRAPAGFDVPLAGNAFAIAPDGRSLAIAHHPTAEELQQQPSLRNDKKALKPALKYRQLVSFFALPEGHRSGTVSTLYDVVMAMRYTADGQRLLVYSVPDLRFNPASYGVGVVDQVDAASGLPLRASCMSRMNGPDLAISPDGLTLALSSTEGRNKRKLTCYELATGDTRMMIDLAQKRRYDKGEGEEHDGRLGYGWLPDGRLIVAQGNDLGSYRP